MSPGISAMTSRRSIRPPASSAMPRQGERVVKGYSATLGVARLTALRSVDLPALGLPTSPTSAISLSSSRSVRSSTGSPGVASLGVWSVDVLKCSFPKPPRPPRTTT